MVFMQHELTSLNNTNAQYMIFREKQVKNNCLSMGPSTISEL